MRWIAALGFEVKSCEGCFDAALDFIAGQREVFQAKGQFVGDCGADELVIRVLKDHADALADGAELSRVAGVHAIDEDPTGLGLLQSV